MLKLVLKVGIVFDSSFCYTFMYILSLSHILLIIFCIIAGFVGKTAIVHFFEIEIKYNSKVKVHAENDGNIGFL